MASTNKTTHYNLSQYVGSDKPTYLVDYNTDMSNIDNGIYNAQSKANNNETNIGNLSNLETTDKTSIVNAINELKGKTDGIGNLSNLTTEANTNLVSAINEVDAHADSNNQNIGTMTNLETTIKTSLVGAINELNTKSNNNSTNIGNLSDLETSDKSSIVNAINELKGVVVYNDSTGVNSGNIPLNVNLLEYDEVEILGYDGTARITETKVFPKENTDFVLDISEVDSSWWTIYNLYGTITQNGITINRQRGFGQTGHTSTDTIYIKKIIARKDII